MDSVSGPERDEYSAYGVGTVMSTPPREARLQVEPNGVHLHVRSWGVERGIPIVISHGFLEQCTAWDTVAKLLNRWVITYDQRGHGQSDHVAADGFYHFFDYVADLDGLVRHINQPVDLIGHSMGGTVASIFTALRPQQVHRLVLIEGLGPPDTTGSILQRGRQFLQHRATPPTHTAMKDVDEGVARMLRFNRSLTHEMARALVLRHTERSPDGQVQWSWDAKHRSRSPRPFSTRQFIQYLNAINHPTLLVFGETSQYLHIPDLEQRMHAISNRTVCTLPGVGHHPHQGCPELLCEHILRHLKEHPHVGSNP